MFPPDYKDMKWWRRMGKPVSPTSTEQGLAQARTVEYPLSLQPRNDGPKNTATVRSLDMGRTRMQMSLAVVEGVCP